jgi:hypothetical protein
VTGEVVTAATLNTYVKDDLLDLDRRTAPQSALVATSQTTTSTSYTDLTTSGPAVTVTTGTTCLVIVKAHMLNSTAATQSWMGYAVSGATTVAASDSLACAVAPSSSLAVFAIGAAFFHTGLTAGSNTFTAKYRVSAGTGTFQDRRIVAIPLGAA